MSRGRLVAMDRSSGRRSPMKAGGDAVRAETGAVQYGPTPLGHRGVDGASRGRKWRRRHGAPVLARGKWANEGRCRATPFYGGLMAFGEEKGGDQQHRERRRRGRVTGGTTGFK
jgi:hypothetical protein